MIIGITGKMGSGKDLIGSYISNKYDFKIIKFADKLKQICSIISGLAIEDMYSNEGKLLFVDHLDMTVGRLQQIVGTELFRNNFDKDFWVKCVIPEVAKYKNIVITDVRFPNEADFIKKVGILIRVQRDSYNFYANSRDTTHISEIALDNYANFDYIIKNDSDINTLLDKVDYIVRQNI